MSVIEKKLQEVLDGIVLDGIQRNKRNVRHSKKPREPNPNFTFYYGSHGYNKSHNNNGCENKKKFHDDSATFFNLNPKIDIMCNKDGYMGPGSGH